MLLLYRGTLTTSPQRTGTFAILEKPKHLEIQNFYELVFSNLITPPAFKYPTSGPNQPLYDSIYKHWGGDNNIWKYLAVVQRDIKSGPIEAGGYHNHVEN